jgi:hypothetical protein
MLLSPAGIPVGLSDFSRQFSVVSFQFGRALLSLEYR